MGDSVVTKLDTTEHTVYIADPDNSSAQGRTELNFLALQGRKLKFKLWPTCPELASRQQSSDPKPESDRCPHLRFFLQNTFMSHEVLSFQPGIVEISLLRK